MTVLVATRNEAANIETCLSSLGPAERVVVVDSGSTDRTQELAARAGAVVVVFHYAGGYPKKRQWALDNVSIDTPWVLLLDADEVVPDALWAEIGATLQRRDARDGYLITKEFHFIGKRLRFGGFSHEALLLFRRCQASFEELRPVEEAGLDMEVHERVLLTGRLGRLKNALVHQDFKGLHAYLDRHNRYSTWEAAVRYQFLAEGRFGPKEIKVRLFGNSQERRRWLKSLALRLPGESWAWFLYHFVLRLGFLEGRRGLIASQVRAHYISQVRAKLFERRQATREGRPNDEP